MKLPEPLYRAVERVYRKQAAIRRAELRAAVAEQDRRFRAACDEAVKRHRMRTCGGAAAGCDYYPCVPKVGHS